MATETKTYRAVDSDTTETIAACPTAALVSASLAAGPEGHVLAVLEDARDAEGVATGEVVIDVAPRWMDRQQALRVYIEEA